MHYECLEFHMFCANTNLLLVCVCVCVCRYSEFAALPEFDIVFDINTVSKLYCTVLYYYLPPPMHTADPTIPKFKEWLNHIGGGEYAAKFLEAGYDLAFIAQYGVSDRDLDCVGVPASKMGLRRKIAQLHELSLFYSAEDEEEEEDDEEEEEVSIA